MSVAEFLLVVAAWCSVPSYSRMSPNEVDDCRKQFIECVQVKSAIVNNLKVLDCSKQQRILK